MSDTITKGYSLSPLQKRNWMWRKSGWNFNNVLLIRIQGDLNIDRLKSALHQIVGFHEILRTSYFVPDNLIYPVQVIHEPYQPIVIGENISDWEADEQLARIASIEGDLVAAVFRLDHPELLRAHLITLSHNNHNLYLYGPSICSDADTFCNLAKELSSYYQADLADGDEHDENLQFVQFSEWQNEILSENDSEGADYWDKKLNLRSIITELPLERYEADKASAAPCVSEIKLRDHLCGRIKALGKKNKRYVADFALTCWTVLLWSYLDKREHIVLGNIESGRTFDAFKRISGLMAKTVPFYVHVDEHQTLSELQAQTQKEAEEVYRWQDNYNATPRNYNPGDLDYFPVGFEYINNQHDVIQSERTSFRIQSLHSNADPFKLKLQVLDHGHGLEFKLYYSPAYFDNASIDCIKEQFSQLLKVAIDSPNTAVGSMVKITAKESEKIKSTFNHAHVHHESVTYIEAFEKQVDKTPDKIAISYSDETLSYSALDRRANQFGNYLIQTCDLRPGQIVAIRMKRSPSMLVALLGIMKAGATFLPIDFHIPESRFRFILQDSKPKVVVEDTPLAGDDECSGNIVYLDNTLDLSIYSTSAPVRVSNPEDTAYIIYTSGSTGKPKGTLISNRSFVNYLLWFKTTYGINETDRTLLFSSIAYDLGYTSLWSSLISGSTLCILEEATLLDPDKLVGKLIDEKITYIKLTPTHFSFITDDPAFEAKGPKYSLRLIVVGGEHIRIKDVEKYINVNNEVRFVNHYGPTETTIGVIAMDVKREDVVRLRSATLIGKPIDNNQVYILNQNMLESPIGVTGEICISGAGVSKGYLNRDDVTREKFIDNPLAPGEVLYKTGDVGRWLPDGIIQLIGRNDFQVKIRGYRVEMGEIEKVLLSIGGVKNVVVLAVHDALGELELHAYIETKVRLNRQKLSDAVCDQLPDYMIPAQFVFMETFPLLANGKINRKQLVEDKVMGTELTHVAPATAIEKMLAGVWQKVLMRDQISTMDNFFSIGGNSLKLVQVFRVLSKDFPNRLTLADLFKYNTISALGHYLHGTSNNNESVEGFQF